MIIEQTADVEVIKTVLCHPKIYGCISSDLSPPASQWSPPFIGEIYLAGYIDDKVVGIFVVHPDSDVTARVHVQVLPEYRTKHGLEFGKSVMEYGFKELKIIKMNAQIPIIYPNVLMFALKCGFIMEGTNSFSYYKDGKLYDQYYLGARFNQCPG